jgi:phage-related protein
MAVIKVVNGIKFAMAGLNIAIQLFNGTLALTPIGWIVIGITALIAVIYMLYRNWDTVSAFMKSSFEIVSQYLSEKIGMLKLLFFAFVDGVKAGAQGIKDGFLGVFGFIGDAGKGFLNTFSGGINKVIELINGVSVDIPAWVPLFGGKTFGFDIPKIPKYQLGTSYHKGGPAEINERGGEIINLPNGSKVIPADKSQKLMNSSGINVQIIIQGNVYGEVELVERVGSKITKKLKLALANM